MTCPDNSCRDVLVDGMADLGIEVTVSIRPHIVTTGYDQGAFICPHKTRYYMEPTSEQRATWARDGVR